MHLTTAYRLGRHGPGFEETSGP